MVRPLALKRIHQEVGEILRDQITSGKLSPGAKLNVKELADQLNISPFPVREAIRELEAVGLVKSIPHRGARVAWLNANEVSDIFTYRLILEPEAARYATRCMANSGADFTLLSQRLRELKEVATGTDVFELLRRDEALLEAVFSETRNSYLIRAIRQIWDNFRPYKVMYLSSIRDNSHRGIVQQWGEVLVAACQSGDEDLAAQCVKDPLELTKSRVVDFVRSLEGEN